MTEITATLVKDLRQKTGLAMMKCKQALQKTNGNIEEAIDFLRKEGEAFAAKKVDREANQGVISMVCKDNLAIIANISCETDFVAASDDFKNYAQQVTTALFEQKPKNIEALLQCSVDGITIQEAQVHVVSKLGENISVKKFFIEKIADNEWVSTYSHLGGKIGSLIKLSTPTAIKDCEKKQGLAKDLAMQVAASSPMGIYPTDIPSDILEKEKEIYKEQAIAEGKPAEFAEKIIEGRIKKFEKEVCLTEQAFIKDSKLSINQLLNNTAKELKEKSIKIIAFHRLQLGE